eukprot:CAMPEP_0196653206 /NCGR_PEP_ID=MMETSP1086-20130531/2813_1 /TAXON_ID=77921 /ORGANISM="Cyanoptyche  gloeocystis , Strain SAG4.97" /LENGTH=60 /DNA_ID=CAMNT_0041984281 /DNA_START=138 /DNA_END=317 /DNA_ORIENTATION=+
MTPIFPKENEILPDPAVATSLKEKTDQPDAALPDVNPTTGEVGGPKGAYKGAEPTRFGDW